MLVHLWQSRLAGATTLLQCPAQILSKTAFKSSIFSSNLYCYYSITVLHRLFQTSPADIPIPCLTKWKGSPQCICPAVAGSVTATSFHMHFCQTKEPTCWSLFYTLCAATTAAAAGVPSWLIKVLSRWGSDFNERDIRTSQKHYLLSLRNYSWLILMLQFRATIRSAWTLSALLSTCKFSPLPFPIYQQ